MIRSEFMAAIKQIASERGIDQAAVFTTLEEAMLAAYRKDYPEQAEDLADVEVEIDKETGEVTLRRDNQDITPPGFGRIATQTAKQVILQGVREAEKEAAVIAFSKKIGEVVPGMLQRYNRGAWMVDLTRALAVMPKEEQVFSEEYHKNRRMKFYVREIRERDGKQDIIVSRADPGLVEALFELEVPEVQSGAVVVRGLAREPGSRTKIAVASTQKGVDPVGSMVGQRGVRVKAVTDELDGEKMDIILWHESDLRYIINALSPAKVIDVELKEDPKTARVEVPEDQLSLAIGKEGQNVRLASKLTGYKIDIVDAEGGTVGLTETEQKLSESGAEKGDLKRLKLPTRVHNALTAAGVVSINKLKQFSEDQLMEIKGIGGKSVQKIASALEGVE